jgi:hypothetical protein
MQVEIRNHIARCLRDYPDGDEGVITLAGVEHCFKYVVHDDVVDAVIGPPDYIEQVVNERRPREEHNQAVLGTSPAFETLPNALAQQHAAGAPAGIGAAPGGSQGHSIYSYRLRLRWIGSLFMRLGSICDSALLDVLGESSRAMPARPHNRNGQSAHADQNGALKARSVRSVGEIHALLLKGSVVCLHLRRRSIVVCFGGLAARRSRLRLRLFRLFAFLTSRERAPLCRRPRPRRSDR